MVKPDDHDHVVASGGEEGSVETYDAPAIEDLGSVAELTQGHSQEHDHHHPGWKCS
jgi:hypothetical protein